MKPIYKIYLYALISIACFISNSCATKIRYPSQKTNPLINISPSAKEKIGKKIWQNECGGTIKGLTSWNVGENFASLGIGHFIWFPKNITPPFQESFPSLIAFMKSRGVAMPNWLANTKFCPWQTRSEFMADFNSSKMTSLRNFLQNTISHQTDFLSLRLQNSLQKMKAMTPPATHEVLERKFFAVASTPTGVYALIDYVNFKGEGTNTKERYQGKGWGLLQVLQTMRTPPKGFTRFAATQQFSKSAKIVLDRRIALAPRNESQWRKGWFRRCDSYAVKF